MPNDDSARLEELRNQIKNRMKPSENANGKPSVKRSQILVSSKDTKDKKDSGARSSFMPRNLKITRPKSRNELERRRALKLAQRAKEERSRDSRDRRPRDAHRDTSPRRGDSDRQRKRGSDRRDDGGRGRRPMGGGGGRDSEKRVPDSIQEQIRRQIMEIKQRNQKTSAQDSEDGEIRESPKSGPASKAQPSNPMDEDSDNSNYSDAEPDTKETATTKKQPDTKTDLIPSPLRKSSGGEAKGTESPEGRGEGNTSEKTSPRVDPMEDDRIESPSPKRRRRRTLHVPAFMGCRSVEAYKRLNTIDEGTYGVVHRAKDIETGEVVALKKIKMENCKGGFPITSLREINILLAIDHPNIVKLKEIVIGKGLENIYMVMEYLDHDVKMLLGQMKQPFRHSEVKSLMRQLLSAVNAMHKGWILHRDLKTSNLLYSNDGILKVCDFGLARKYGSPIGKYTRLVVTLWYRAPELLLGTTTYTQAVDMWSVGCIFAEFLTTKALLPGKGEMDQLEKIFTLLGSPNAEEWPEYENLPHTKNFRWTKNKKSKLRQKFPKQNFGGGFYLDDIGFDLLSRMLCFNPNKRITAEEALNHEWFNTAPRPQSLALMPTFPSANEKNRRRHRKPRAESKAADGKAKNGFFMK